MANYMTPYQNTWGYTGVGQMYPQYPQNVSAMQNPFQPQTAAGIRWVDGEVGAKAYQLPSGWPANTPIDLWDTNDTVIYLKSINQMGMPNPLQRIRYQIEDQQRPAPVEQRHLESGDAEKHDGMEQYVRKDELEAMKDELKEAIRSMGMAETKAVKNNAKSTV